MDKQDDGKVVEWETRDILGCHPVEAAEEGGEAGSGTGEVRVEEAVEGSYCWSEGQQASVSKYCSRKLCHDEYIRIEEATEEKCKLEQKQREEAKERKETGEKWENR